MRIANGSNWDEPIYQKPSFLLLAQQQTSKIFLQIIEIVQLYYGIPKNRVIGYLLQFL
jgi:hypothetical protein